MLLTVREIASGIRASRSEFSRVFLQAQVDVVMNPLERLTFECMGGATVDADAFAAALQVAQARGWLEELVTLLVAERMEDGSLTRALATDPNNSEHAPALQAMVHAVKGFDEPDVAYRGIAGAMRWTVKIMVDGVAQGTGVLVYPHLVLTAWHVVKSLFHIGPSGSWEPDGNAGPRLTIEFDNILVLLTQGTALAPRSPTRVRAHEEDWCLAFSPCHSDELSSKLPHDLLELRNHWDYALLRLASAPGSERLWAPLSAKSVVPSADSNILVFQHPVGGSMRTGPGTILGADPETCTAVPRMRFLHRANTLPGASGGPCFDKSFAFFGLHQGVWSQGEDDAHTVNRGTPVVGVLEHIKTLLGDLPLPDPTDCPIWRLDASKLSLPVIGCDDFQRVVWQSALTDAPRILCIGGAPGVGKSHRLDVLTTLLPTAGHLIVPLLAPSIANLPGEELADAICRCAGAAPSSQCVRTKADSTAAAWIRDELVPRIIRTLDSVRAGRRVWIVLADLNKTRIRGINTSELLFALYEQVPTFPWLRFVLDGMSTNLPFSVSLWSQTLVAGPPSQEDIAAYFRRAIADLRLLPEATAILAGAVDLTSELQSELSRDPREAMSKMARGAARYLQSYLHAIRRQGAA